MCTTYSEVTVHATSRRTITTNLVICVMDPRPARGAGPHQIINHHHHRCMGPNMGHMHPDPSVIGGDRRYSCTSHSASEPLDLLR